MGYESQVLDAGRDISGFRMENRWIKYILGDSSFHIQILVEGDDPEAFDG